MTAGVALRPGPGTSRACPQCIRAQPDSTRLRHVVAATAQNRRSPRAAHAARPTGSRRCLRTLGTTRAPELRASGAAVQRAAGGSVALSAQERTIAELAAAGQSNKHIAARLYLSPRTVGAHLYRIFPKLGVTSRAALGQALRDLDGP